MKQLTIPYDVSLRPQWISGMLPRLWMEQYPSAFDSDDLRLALSQPMYHFGEWIAAIYYARQGYSVLVEQYIYETHKRKVKILEKLIGKGNMVFLRNSGVYGKIQPPDLFVYDKKHFFFVEVKLLGDVLHSRQEEFFCAIEKRFSTDVFIAKLGNMKK